MPRNRSRDYDYGYGREDRTFKVIIHEGEMEQIHEWTLKKDNIETGGDLFGLWIDEHTAVVQFVLGPGERCRRTATSFYQDVNYLEKAGTYLTKHQGLCNIGQWHSHHRLSLTHPSGGDENTVWGNMPNLRLNRYIVFIATIHGGWQLSKAQVNCFLFEINNGRQLPVLRANNYDLLPRNSPLRLNESILQKIWKGAESMNKITWYKDDEIARKNLKRSNQSKEGSESHEKQAMHEGGETGDEVNDDDREEEGSIENESTEHGKRPRIEGGGGEALITRFSQPKGSEIYDTSEEKEIQEKIQIGSGPGKSTPGGSGPGESTSGGSGPGERAVGGSAIGRSGPGESAAGGSGPEESDRGGSGPEESATGGSGPGESAAGGSGPEESATGVSGLGENAASEITPGGSCPGGRCSGESAPGEKDLSEDKMSGQKVGDNDDEELQNVQYQGTFQKLELNNNVMAKRRQQTVYINGNNTLLNPGEGGFLTNQNDYYKEGGDNREKGTARTIFDPIDYDPSDKWNGEASQQINERQQNKRKYFREGEKSGCQPRKAT